MWSRIFLALFQSTTAKKIDSEQTRDYKRLLPVCKAEILGVTIKQEMIFMKHYAPNPLLVKRVHKFLMPKFTKGYYLKK